MSAPLPNEITRMQILRARLQMVWIALFGERIFMLEIIPSPIPNQSPIVNQIYFYGDDIMREALICAEDTLYMDQLRQRERLGLDVE